MNTQIKDVALGAFVGMLLGFLIGWICGQSYEKSKYNVIEFETKGFNLKTIWKKEKYYEPLNPLHEDSEIIFGPNRP